MIAVFKTKHKNSKSKKYEFINFLRKEIISILSVTYLLEKKIYNLFYNNNIQNYLCYVRTRVN